MTLCEDASLRAADLSRFGRDSCGQYPVGVHRDHARSLARGLLGLTSLGRLSLARVMASLASRDRRTVVVRGAADENTSSTGDDGERRGSERELSAGHEGPQRAAARSSAAAALARARRASIRSDWAAATAVWASKTSSSENLPAA